jgi:hypothetical protein
MSTTAGIFMSSPAFIVRNMSSFPLRMSISLSIIYFLSTPSMILMTATIAVDFPSISPSIVIVNSLQGHAP